MVILEVSTFSTILEFASTDTGKSWKSSTRVAILLAKILTGNTTDAK